METVIVPISEVPSAKATGRSKWLLFVACGLTCFMIWTLGARMGLSRTRGFDGSLLLAPGAIGNVVITFVLVFAAIVIGTVIAGTVRPDAGLFTGAIGLAALSIAGRPVYAVLHDADGSRGAYLTLAAELVLLYGALGVGWFALSTLVSRGKLQDDVMRDGLADIELPANAGWSAFVAHVLTMAVAVALLAQSEDKKQVLAAVALGSFAGAFFPYWQQGVRPSVWYWTGPLVVGLIGHLFAFMSPGAGTVIGRPGLGGGILAGLARPLPLDYAGIGTAGALIGYWMRRKSLHDRDLMNAAASSATNTPHIEQASA